MGSPMTYQITVLKTVYIQLYITPFPICFVGVAQLTLGMIVPVSLPCLQSSDL